jgi:hypothetical protein
MYTAQITRTETGAPIGDQKVAHLVATRLGGSGAEFDEPAYGIWLVDLSADNVERIERDGYLTTQVGPYTIEIDTP